MPGDTVSKTSEVLYDGVTGQYGKQITITNNSTTQTIYPFLEDANSRTATPGDPTPAPNYTGTGMFDPFDALAQEYRGYVGYSQIVDGKTVNYMGLLPGSSITIDVPLVFWDAGRIIVTTDGADLKGTGSNGNPFLYADQNTQETDYGSVSGDTLTFTPEYNSFVYNSTNKDYEPSSAIWNPPSDLATGMLVSGSGIPANTTITVGSDAHSITLNPPSGSPITTPAGITSFTFTSTTAISATLRHTQPGYTITSGNSSAQNGVVMWYHALTAHNPNNSAPFQLIEMSFRGTFYNPKSNVGTGFNYLIGFDTPDTNYISANDFDLVNYDVSYVDSFGMPVSVEADSVPVPNSQPPAAPPFGWVGTSLTIDQLQSAFASFTSSNSGLGTYFGGMGYPSYYAPPDVDSIKLPSGQNLFLQSPFNTGSNLSSFSDLQTFPDGSNVNLPLYALSDGGSGPFSIPAGGATDPNNIPDPTATELILAHTSEADQYKLQLLASALATTQFTVTSSENGALPSGTVVQRMLTDPVTGQIVGVKLSQPLNSTDPKLYVYTFTRPTTDPIATDIASLWYSWANYYATTVTSLPAKNVSGSLLSNILTLTSPTFELVPGMEVFDVQGTYHGVITSVGSDNRTITLSRSSGALNDSFNFLAPNVNLIAGYDPGGLTPSEPLTFDPDEQAFAMAFAQNVYVVMSTMSDTVTPGTANAAIPLMANIIGGNVGPGFLTHENAAIQATITNQIKSALRGVPDFTSPLYSNPSQWYPDPALPNGGQSFNVFNLDPFIWFIHQKLGLSAYAFALDDDIGDVGAGGATTLDVSVGGLGELPQQFPFANTANYGPVNGTVATAPLAGSSVITGLPVTVVNQIAAANFSNNTPGALVNGPGVPIGTTVLTTDNLHGTVTLSAPITSSQSGSVTYEFFGPVVGTGTVLGAGQPTDTIDGLDMDAYNTLMALGDLSNVQVTGPGIDPGSTVTVSGLSMVNGSPVVTLSENLDASQISGVGGSFSYTFGYATLNPVVDSGFEQPAGVAGLTGGYLHGTQLQPSGDQPWTFTDGNAAQQIYAGIAGNGSIYTKGNGPALQGLQVGFIQGNSSISQPVNFAAGSYRLSFLAAQAAGNTANQSLAVMIDGQSVGTSAITPDGTMYVQYMTAVFTVTSGVHSITFQGGTQGTNTVLIDAVTYTPASPPKVAERLARPVTIEFLSQPANNVSRGRLGPISIAVLDKFGRRWSRLTVRVTLIRIGARSRGHFVRGSVLRAKTVNGIATFRRLAISAPGKYQLRVEVGGKRLRSQVFVIVGGKRSGLRARR